MYNEQRKIQFLKQREENTTQSKNLENIFELSENIEERLGRDIADWSTSEIISFYKYYSTSSLQSLIVINNSLTAYTNWCIVNGLVTDNQNHFLEFDTVMLSNCVDLNKLHDMVITREKLLQEIELLPNAQDAFIFLGLFEGIPLRDGIIGKIRLSDLNGNVLTLPDGKTLTLSNKLVDIMHEADAEITYKPLRETGREKRLEDKGTIIKEIIHGKKKESVDITPLIGRRIRNCAAVTDIPNITVKMLQESGRIDLIKRIMERENITFEESIRVPYKEEHEAIYGKIQSSLSYMISYGYLFEKT